MEHLVRAPADGVVAEVRVAKGQHVENGALLLVFEPDDGPGSEDAAVSAPIRIANCSGFYGDRLSAAREMVEGGPIDVLTGDWLAELTMLILARTRAKRPGGGYARSFVTQMEQVMGTCLDRGIKVVSNAGGLDPDGCADAVAEVADRARACRRPSPTSTATTCCPGSTSCVAAGVDLAHFETGEPLGDTTRFISANAYLGCWGIVEALQPRRRHRRDRPHHRRRRRVRPGGVAPRLGPRRLGRARRRRSSPATSSSAARRPPAATTRSSPRCPA